jgi:hypothetical protein
MEKIEINKFLPFGVSLRDVLQHPSLTPTNLKYLLRQRGIFIESNDDVDTFPLLTTTILSPFEFEFIKERIKSKEDNSKIVSRNIVWTSNEPLINAVPDHINLKRLMENNNSRFKVISQTNFAMVENNPNKVRMEFKCETNNYNSSWYRSKNEFPGEIILEKIQTEGKVYMKMIYTSPETFETSDRGIKFLESYFKENNYAANDRESERILYRDFDNDNRIRFLLSLTENSNIFEFVRITDLDIGPDPSQEPSDEFRRLMSGNVKELKINGDSLHQSFLINEVQNHAITELSIMEVIYNFNYHAASGNCKIRFGFENYFKKRFNNIEFSLNIAALNLNDQYASLSKDKVKLYLLQEFEKVVIAKYNLNKNP